MRRPSSVGDCSTTAISDSLLGALNSRRAYGVDAMRKTAPIETPGIALTMQFLAFVAAKGRTYGETMEAWRSTCPRLSIWEDAVRDGLVRIENGGAMKSSRIMLTERGRARLARGSGGNSAACSGPRPR